MRTVYTLFAYLFLSAVLVGCDNEINVAADYKDIPVLYGKINASDSIQYIRIQKGYLSNTTDATVLAKYRDSIYYPDGDLTVVITNEVAPFNFRDTLKRVNGNDYGFKKDSGIFFNEQNILYRSTKKLSPLTKYVITCYNNKRNTQFSASTNTIGEFDISSPNTIPPVNTPPVIYFAKDTAGIYQSFNFKIRKRSSADNDDWKTYSFGADIIMSYDEWNINNPSVITNKKIVWKAYNLQTPSVNNIIADLSINGSTFFTAFSGMERNKNLVRRLNPSATVIVKITNTPYTEYLKTRDVQSSSISSDEALPIYTNVKNGIGLLYGEVQKEYPIFVLSPNIINYVACDASTLDLNFLDSKDKLCK